MGAREHRNESEEILRILSWPRQGLSTPPKVVVAMPSVQAGRFSVGKIPPAALLRSVFPYVGKKNSRVVVKPGIGRDAAIIRYGRMVLAFSTDPITGTATHIGSHSVIINANDIATTGARPALYLCTLLLPVGSDERLLHGIMSEIHETAKALGVSVVGGHTEVTAGLDRPIIAGFMVGEGETGRVLSAEGGRDGDRVLFTKTAGLEGTAILASDFSSSLRGIGPNSLNKAKTFSRQLSVTKEALAIAKLQGVHAMHDPTEGGVLNGLWELAEASKLGIEARADRIKVASETREICSILGLDPLKLMSSGSLLIAVDPSAAGIVQRRLRQMGVRVSDVGVLSPQSSGRYVLRGGRMARLEAVPRDELYRLT